MYLMISLVFFALSSLLGDEIVVNGGEVGAEQLSDERREVLEAGRQDVEAALQELARLSERVRSESEARAGEGDAAVAPTSPEALTTSEATSAGTAEFDLCDSLQNALPSAWQQLVDACNKIAAEGGAEALVSELRDNVPMMMFLFIPLVALSMKLLYPLAKRKYIEHLLFVLHFHAFFFLFATIGILIENLVELAPVLRSGMQILVTVGSIYLMVYLFAAMRRVYRQGWLATSIKYILLAIGYAATLLVSFALTLGYTAINL
jgi:Tfp pilus assembly protein PilE